MAKPRVKVQRIVKAVVDTVRKVIDGDTQEILLDLGFDSFEKIETRINGLDCPEKNTAAGKMVRDFVSQWLAEAMKLKNNLEWWSIVKEDKYGRSLGDYIRLDKPELSLGADLLGCGLAKPYSGVGQRAKWTEEELAGVVQKFQQGRSVVCLKRGTDINRRAR